MNNLGMWALNLTVVSIVGFVAWSLKKMLSSVEKKIDGNSDAIGAISKKSEVDNKERSKEIILLSEKIEMENRSLSDKIDHELKGIADRFEDKLETLRRDIDGLGGKTDDRFKALEKEFADYKVDAAYKFVKQEEFVRAIAGMDRKLDKIYEKLTVEKKGGMLA